MRTSSCEANSMSALRRWAACPLGPQRLDVWTTDCERIWRERTSTLPSDSPSRCPHGFYIFAYEMGGAKRTSLTELLEILREAPRLTGWPTIGSDCVGGNMGRDGK